MWTKILKIEKSQFNNSKLAYFNFNGTERYAIISNKVLEYNKVEKLNIGDRIFVIKSIGKDDKGVFFIKNVEQ